MKITRESDYIAFVSGARYQNGKIEIDDETISAIKESALVVFKGVFDPDFLTELRKDIVNFDYQYHDYVVNADGRLNNFSRWDDLLHRDRRACRSMCYSMFHWNPDTPASVNAVRTTLTRFGNRIAGRNENERLTEDADLNGTVLGYYYPPGSCLRSHHFTDDFIPSFELFDEMIVPFATYGRDYFEGGLYVAPRFQLAEIYDPSDHGELRFMENDIAAGDVVAFTTKNVYHCVEPIDPKADTPFDPMTGRFLLAFTYSGRSEHDFLTSKAGCEADSEQIPWENRGSQP